MYDVWLQQLPCQSRVMSALSVLQKLLKSHRRPSLGDKRLSNLLILEVEKEITDNVKLHKVVEKWPKHKNKK